MRFARVPTGSETCTFCLMLASRGAVYHTRESAGTFRCFHRGCDCKVVPGFEAARDAELVEGVRPKEIREQWRRFKEIDSDGTLDTEHRDALKRRVLNLEEAKSGPSTYYRAENLDLSHLSPGELKHMQKKNPLEWESYVQLSKGGYESTLLHEQGNASANIDISMSAGSDRHYWDMKTIEGGLGALKKRLAECYSKWVRLSSSDSVVPDGIDESALDNPRAVVDNRFSKVTDREAERQIRESMAYLSSKGGFRFAQVLLIMKDGTFKLVY